MLVRSYHPLPYLGLRYLLSTPKKKRQKTISVGLSVVPRFSALPSNTVVQQQSKMAMLLTLASAAAVLLALPCNGAVLNPVLKHPDVDVETMWKQLYAHCAAGKCSLSKGSKLSGLANTTDCKGRMLAYGAFVGWRHGPSAGERLRTPVLRMCSVCCFSVLGAVVSGTTSRAKPSASRVKLRLQPRVASQSGLIRSAWSTYLLAPSARHLDPQHPVVRPEVTASDPMVRPEVTGKLGGLISYHCAVLSL